MFTGTNEQLKEKLLPYMQDVYFMEKEFTRTFENYAEEIKKFKKFPEFQAKIYRYLEVFKPHPLHIEDRLRFYKLPTPTKPITPIFNFVNYFTTLKPVTFAEFVFNIGMMENFKISVYRWLTTMAHAYGDKETLMIAEQHLRENVELRRWLFERLPEVCLYSLEYEGVPIPQSAWDFAKELELVGMTTTFTPTVPNR